MYQQVSLQVSFSEYRHIHWKANTSYKAAREKADPQTEGGPSAHTHKETMKSKDKKTMQGKCTCVAG